MAELSADVIAQLQAALISLHSSEIGKDILEPMRQVLDRFQPLFSPEHIPTLTAEEFQSFLRAENNRHWSGLHRQGPKMRLDMAKLRGALATLVTEGNPVAQRLDYANDNILGMGKNVASAILLITHPDTYGLWNNRSETVMKRMDIWPRFNHGDSFGERYVKVNEVLTQCKNALNTDFWTLDVLWWYLDQPEPDEATGQNGTLLESEQRFGLERHLHEFLLDNWDKTELGKEWILYGDPGDDEPGYEYSCGVVGRIDLLAKHKQDGSWLVIELKREQSNDQTVAQILRYMGWIKQHRAGADQVRGLIICRDTDRTLRYVMNVVPNIEIRLYEVEFRLKQAELTAEAQKSNRAN